MSPDLPKEVRNVITNSYFVIIIDTEQKTYNPFQQSNIQTLSG